MSEVQEYMLVSYAKVDGIRTYPDSEIRALYTRLVDEGGGHVFRDGSVRDAEGFVRMAKATPFFVLYVRGKIAGAVWLNRFQSRFAQCHYFIFREFWGESATGLCRYCQREILTQRREDGEYCLDMMLGLIPADNRLAVAYALRCGWRNSGVLPFGSYCARTGASGPAVVVTISREGLQ